MSTSPEISRRSFLALSGATLASTFLPSDSVLAAATMNTRAIPRTGEKLPVIGLGTYQSFDFSPASSNMQSGLAVLKEFHARGGRVVDSSPMYGSAEEVVGKLSAEAGINGNLFIATKVWTSGKQAGIAQMNRSFELLQRKRVELMQVHNLLDIDTHIPTLREWKAAGKLRYIGATHYTEGAHDDLERAMSRYKLDFIQVNYSILERGAEERLLPAALDRGVAVIVNRPFAQGGFFSRVRGKALPAIAQELGCKSWAQLALKYIVGNPAVTCAIPATSKVEHLIDNMGAGPGALPDSRQRRAVLNAFESL
jgi:diketogulonate reductase-like aldo/keto reductase